MADEQNQPNDDVLMPETAAPMDDAAMSAGTDAGSAAPMGGTRTSRPRKKKTARKAAPAAKGSRKAARKSSRKAPAARKSAKGSRKSAGGRKKSSKGGRKKR